MILTAHYLDAIYDARYGAQVFEGPENPGDPLHNDCGTGKLGHDSTSPAQRKSTPK
jgi:hypothetical protein